MITRGPTGSSVDAAQTQAAFALVTDRNPVITCLVADDHPAVVEAVADVLEENGIEIAGRARDGQWQRSSEEDTRVRLTRAIANGHRWPPVDE